MKGGEKGEEGGKRRVKREKKYEGGGEHKALNTVGSYNKTLLYDHIHALQCTISLSSFS